MGGVFHLCVLPSVAMVLCDLPSDNFFLAWGVLCALGITSLFTFSGIVFYKYYVNPTYEMWQWKSNPKYPAPTKVRDEIRQMVKGAVCGTILPALALTTLKTSGHSKAFCDAELGWKYQLGSFLALWIFSDFYEWFYHYLGHRFVFMWQFHKAHHVFFNPTPFAVIADEYVDMIMRSSPMLFIPLLVPIDMDLLFGVFAVFFYGYGTFIHWGYETPWLDAHNPVINTPFQHYCHHAVSGRKTTYHTGFFSRSGISWPAQSTQASASAPAASRRLVTVRVLHLTRSRSLITQCCCSPHFGLPRTCSRLIIRTTT